MQNLTLFVYKDAGLNSNCSNGDIRLNGSTKENEGMIECCYDNNWAHLCSLSEHTATLICKMLGYRDCKLSKLKQKKTLSCTSI